MLVGDVMVDVCLQVARAVEGLPVSTLIPDLQACHYLAATLHRAENTDDPERLRQLVEALKALPLSVVLPVHPQAARPSGGGGGVR